MTAMDAPPGTVWSILANGWSYSDWVVGTAHIRAVDATWPATGSDLHYDVGPWPASRKEFTRVLQVKAGARLVLAARLWPAGQVTVEIVLTGMPDGGTRVELTETPAHGPIKWLHNPLQNIMLAKRNQASLARLTDLARR